MENTIKITGTIIFDPDNFTKKQESQGNWKRVAMIMIPGDTHLLYSWFINKRFDLPLIPPLRKSHVTIINDRFSDVKGKTHEDRIELWNKVKEKWNHKEVEITLNVDPVETIRRDKKRSEDLNHWWLVIPEEDRVNIHNLRAELGLSRPFFGLHLTLGRCEDTFTSIDDIDSQDKMTAQKAKKMNVEHSKYIVKLIQNGYCE